MSKHDIQNIVSKYIHQDPDIVQDMVLEYRNYASEFLSTNIKSVSDIHYAICPRWFASQCGFVLWSTYNLLFQNKLLNKVFLIAYSDKISLPTFFDNSSLYSSLFDIDICIDHIYSDLWFEVSEDIILFEKCICQLIYIYTYHKIDSVCMLLLPYGYDQFSQIIKKNILVNDLQTWYIFVWNLTKYESSLWQITKEEFLEENQNILDNFFEKKLKHKKRYKNNFQDFELFLNFASLFYKKNPILAMYYDNYRSGNKQAESYVWVLV